MPTSLLWRRAQLQKIKVEPVLLTYLNSLRALKGEPSRPSYHFLAYKTLFKRLFLAFKRPQKIDLRAQYTWSLTRERKPAHSIHGLRTRERKPGKGRSIQGSWCRKVVEQVESGIFLLVSRAFLGIIGHFMTVLDYDSQVRHRGSVVTPGDFVCYWAPYD